MGFKTVQSLDADTTIALGKKDKKTGQADPNSVEGYYLGKRVTTGGKYGDSTLHFFQTKTGNVGVWGATDLDRKLSTVPAGTMVRATRAGTIPTKNGDMKSYKVEVDDENSIEVNISASSAAEDNDTETGTGFGDTGSDYENNDSDDTANEAEQAALEAAAARKAKVDALLRGNKGSKTK